MKCTGFSGPVFAFGVPLFARLLSSRGRPRSYKIRLLGFAFASAPLLTPACAKTFEPTQVVPGAVKSPSQTCLTILAQALYSCQPAHRRATIGRRGNPPDKAKEERKKEKKKGKGDTRSIEGPLLQKKKKKKIQHVSSYYNHSTFYFLFLSLFLPDPKFLSSLPSSLDSVYSPLLTPDLALSIYFSLFACPSSTASEALSPTNQHQKAQYTGDFRGGGITYLFSVPARKITSRNLIAYKHRFRDWNSDF